MAALGHPRFAIVGHDRGAYAAFRTALDHPDAVSHLGILDAVPIADALARCGERFARLWWHWFFFAQPGKPERAIGADPDAWYGGSPERMGAEAYEDYRAAIHDPATVHGMIEDYRAGLGIDRQHDETDRAAGRRIVCPTSVLWALEDDLPELYGDVLEVWRPWAADLEGGGIASGHHMAEDAPEAVAAAIAALLRRG
jgi:haloacetate dehalogenase